MYGYTQLRRMTDW